MIAGGELGKVTKVDDYTVKYTFAQPYGLFIQFAASIDTRPMLMFAKHYAQQFHADYTDKAKLDETVQAAGFASWRDLFIAKVGQPDGGGWGPWGNAGRPTLFAWMVEEPYTASATQVVMVPNPYYWKVDQNGQQYPYIDKVVYDVFQDVPAMLLKATNGEIDFQMRHFNTLTNKAVLFDNQEKGDKDFRIGLSYALNRQEIIDTVYVGQAKPMQPAALEGTPFYSEQLATQYIEYDVAKANEYLDKVLPNKDGNGMRLRPDGQPFVFAVEVANAYPEQVDAATNFLSPQWKAVGVAAEARVEDRALMYERKNNNDLDAMLWGGEGGMNPILDPRNFFPYSQESAFAVAWALWGSGQTASPAEEPPDNIKKYFETFNKVKSSPTFEEQISVMNELLQMSADDFFCIGISTMPAGYGIVKNNMQNVPASLINSWSYPTPAPVNTFTFFYG
jgi:peptide/nickel transport system substrate-binding protein